MLKDDLPWIAFYRAYADPSFAPDWRAGPDCPKWNAIGPDPKAEFAAYVSDQVDELNHRVRQDVERMLTIGFPEEAYSALMAATAKGDQAARADESIAYTAYRMSHSKGTWQDYEKLVRRTKEMEFSGKSTVAKTILTDREKMNSLSGKAAWDLWRIRKVIYPRFWSSEFMGGHKALDDAKIAVSRHLSLSEPKPGITDFRALLNKKAKATESWYEKNRLGGR